ncbi:uncharacterized protein BcabD6B2_44810 [Babesia caballi]|uniref:Membrane protein, putative n=1 Tax=Babesia caballi TaxID=5871 RepID=A0AAV4LYY5_BABCB|nr:membrane protein, putative [Babesia caballi]
MCGRVCVAGAARERRRRRLTRCFDVGPFVEKCEAASRLGGGAAVGEHPRLLRRARRAATAAAPQREDGRGRELVPARLHPRQPNQHRALLHGRRVHLAEGGVRAGLREGERGDEGPGGLLALDLECAGRHARGVQAGRGTREGVHSEGGGGVQRLQVGCATGGATRGRYVFGTGLGVTGSSVLLRLKCARCSSRGASLVVVNIDTGSKSAFAMDAKGNVFKPKGGDTDGHRRCTSSATGAAVALAALRAMAHFDNQAQDLIVLITERNLPYAAGTRQFLDDYFGRAHFKWHSGWLHHAPVRGELRGARRRRAQPGRADLLPGDRGEPGARRRARRTLGARRQDGAERASAPASRGAAGAEHIFLHAHLREAGGAGGGEHRGEAAARPGGDDADAQQRGDGAGAELQLIPAGVSRPHLAGVGLRPDHPGAAAGSDGGSRLLDLHLGFPRACGGALPLFGELLLGDMAVLSLPPQGRELELRQPGRGELVAGPCGARAPFDRRRCRGGAECPSLQGAAAAARV